ncbi:MAG: dicarboxylate/amino acid:cation symporter [Bacteroidaceae bacterium]
MKRIIVWGSALLLGAYLGTLGLGWLNVLCAFIASVFTRLFQFVAIPTIALAVTTTLASLGNKQGVAGIFQHTIVYTLLTTLSASLVGLALFLIISPSNLPADVMHEGSAVVPQSLHAVSYSDHILATIPNNVIEPFAQGNVMSVLLVSVCVGLALAHLLKKKANAGVVVVQQILLGLQELFYTLINAIIWILPLGIMAFAAQLSTQVSAGIVVGSLGKYIAVILGGNLLQIFVVLPLFLLARGIHPLCTFRSMFPAVMMAFFTKSSAATLPVTIRSAEKNLGISPSVSRFVLPICTTINMNGCATFILVTSLFVMQNGGMVFSLPMLLLWVGISVLSAVGNAGVPMGCYFLTLSLMSGIEGAPIGIMGIILPIFTVIDMVETAENVWSDSCVCSLVAKDIRDKVTG